MGNSIFPGILSPLLASKAVICNGNVARFALRSRPGPGWRYLLCRSALSGPIPTTCLRTFGG